MPTLELVTNSNASPAALTRTTLLPSPDKLLGVSLKSVKFSTPRVDMVRSAVTSDSPLFLPRVNLAPPVMDAKEALVTKVSLLPEPVSVFVKVILSPERAILNPVPASRVTSSVLPSESVSLILSSSELTPLTHDIP